MTPFEPLSALPKSTPSSSVVSPAPFKFEDLHPVSAITPPYSTFGQAQETIRTALAMGGDRGIHVKTDMRIDQDLQPLNVVRLAGASLSTLTSFLLP